jgi:hypothetical protein
MEYFRQFEAEACRLERSSACDEAKSVLHEVYRNVAVSAVPETVSEGTVAGMDDTALECLKVCVEFTGMLTARATVDIPIDLNMSAYKAHLELLYDAFVVLKIPPAALTDEYTDDVDLTCSPRDLPMLYGHHVLLVEVFERRGQDPSLLEGSARRREVLTPSRTVDLILHDTSTRRTVSLETHTNSDMSALALRVKESLHEAVRPLSVMTVGTGRTGPLLPKTGIVRDALVAGSELPRPFAYITSFYALIGGGKRALATLDDALDDDQGHSNSTASSALATCPSWESFGLLPVEVLREELNSLKVCCTNLGWNEPADHSMYMSLWTAMDRAEGDVIASTWASRIRNWSSNDTGRVKLLMVLLGGGDGNSVATAGARASAPIASSSCAAVAPTSSSFAAAAVEVASDGCGLVVTLKIDLSVSLKRECSNVPTFWPPGPF